MNLNLKSFKDGRDKVNMELIYNVCLMWNPAINRFSSQRYIQRIESRPTGFRVLSCIYRIISRKFGDWPI